MGHAVALSALLNFQKIKLIFILLIKKARQQGGTPIRISKNRSGDISCTALLNSGNKADKAAAWSTYQKIGRGARRRPALLNSETRRASQGHCYAYALLAWLHLCRHDCHKRGMGQNLVHRTPTYFLTGGSCCRFLRLASWERPDSQIILQC